MIYLEPPDHPRLRGLLFQAFNPERFERIASGSNSWSPSCWMRWRARASWTWCGTWRCRFRSGSSASCWASPERTRRSCASGRGRWRARSTPSRTWPPSRAGTRRRRPSPPTCPGRSTQSGRARENDLITALLSVEVDGNRLTQQELVSSILFFFLAGQETTANLIATGMLSLATHPEQLALLRARPEAHPLRHRGDAALRKPHPDGLPPRDPGRDPARKTIPAGAHVMVVLGAANRDAEKFEDPDRFEVQRQNRGQVAFSHGAPLHRRGAGPAGGKGAVPAGAGAASRLEAARGQGALARALGDARSRAVGAAVHTQAALTRGATVSLEPTETLRHQRPRPKRRRRSLRHRAAICGVSASPRQSERSRAAPWPRRRDRGRRRCR